MSPPQNGAEDTFTAWALGPYPKVSALATNCVPAQWIGTWSSPSMTSSGSKYKQVCVISVCRWTG